VSSAYLKRLSRQFSISAPRMAVRTHLGWPWKAALGLALVAIFAGMWWWGFDFGQFLGWTNRHQTESRIATLEADAATAQAEAVALRARNTQLESDLAMMRGLQGTLQKQHAETQAENAQLKDELAFFRQFFADANKTPGVAVQRIAVDSNGGDVARFSILMVRGAATKEDFEGQVRLQAELVPGAAAEAGARPLTVTLPGDRPESALPLKLKFKYYQRVEGTFPIPPGYLLRAVTARVYEAGDPSPRATRTLTLP
jgi:hypothetical protein